MMQDLWELLWKNHFVLKHTVDLSLSSLRDSLRKLFGMEKLYFSFQYPPTGASRVNLSRALRCFFLFVFVKLLWGFDAKGIDAVLSCSTMPLSKCPEMPSSARNLCMLSARSVCMTDVWFFFLIPWKSLYKKQDLFFCQRFIWLQKSFSIVLLFSYIHEKVLLVTTVDVQWS